MLNENHILNKKNINILNINIYFNMVNNRILLGMLSWYGDFMCHDNMPGWLVSINHG